MIWKLNECEEVRVVEGGKNSTLVEKVLLFLCGLSNFGRQNFIMQITLEGGGRKGCLLICFDFGFFAFVYANMGSAVVRKKKKENTYKCKYIFVYLYIFVEAVNGSA